MENMEMKKVEQGKRTLAVDTGFSYCKCMVEGVALKFPSAIASKRVSGFEGEREKGLLSFEGRDYRVGEAALAADNKKYLRDVSFLMTYAPLLVAHAMDLVGMQEMPEVLAVGLPLADHHRYQRELRRRLTAFVVEGRAYQFPEIVIFPQGVGALADYVTQENPSIGTSGYLFDVGFNTLISLRFDGLSAQRDGSRQYDQMGISRPLEQVIDALRAKHGIELDMLSLNTAFLKGEIRGDVGGKIDIRAIAEPVIDEYLDELLALITNNHGRYFDAADRIILSGGGAYYLQNLIPERYRDKIWVSPQPEFANARGFYQLGMGR